MTDARCTGWSTLLQRHASDFLPSVAVPHAADGCTPCLTNGAFFVASSPSLCVNLRHYRVCGRAAVAYLLRHAMPTDYDIDVLRSQSASMALAQQELESARRAVIRLSARIRSLAAERAERTRQLREAFSSAAQFPS